MAQESGFFFDISSSEPVVGELTLVHRSSSGPCELYRARKDGSFRVFKALKEEYRGNPIYESMLRKEYRIGYELEHPSICRTYSFCTLPDIGNCIELEWIDGRTLQEYFEEKPSRKQLRRVLCDVCRALEYIHQRQMIHRDIKEENILISYNGDNVKLIDFGVSDTDSNLLQKGPAGTFSHASPEILSGGKTDLRTDLWSLGVVMSKHGLYPSIASKCLKRNPVKRYQSAAELREALERTGFRPWYYVAAAAVIVAVASLLYASSHRAADDDFYFKSATEAIQNANSTGTD